MDELYAMLGIMGEQSGIMGEQMKLYPQDLRANDHINIVRRRAHAASSGGAPTSSYVVSPGVVMSTTYDPNAQQAMPEPKLGVLGKLWARGLGMTDEKAAISNAAASSWTQSAAWLTALLGPILPGALLAIAAKKSGLDPALAWASFGGITAGIAALGFGPFAEAAFKNLHKPLQTGELEQLMKDAVGSLDTAYLRLVRDALITSTNEKAEADIRAAIEALGQAIERLPEVIAEPLDTAALRIEAIQLEQQALGEPDKVTSDSLSRRSLALERRADAHDKSALLSKRAAALRAEIQAQIETLREGLAGHQLEANVGPNSSFTELSETARRVAQEAASAAEARQELAQVRVGN
jgi:hypothetical protein